MTRAQGPGRITWLRQSGQGLLLATGIAAWPQAAPPGKPFAGEAVPGAPPVAAPVHIQRFVQAGPLAGVAARVNLRDPRVELDLVMAGDAPPGAEKCAGRLDVPSAVARRHGFAVAINASYFRAEAKDVEGRKVPYFVGNCGTPVGWHVAEGRILARPTEAHIQATLVVQAGGRLSLHPRLEQLPADTRFAVSGNALVLVDGQVTSRPGAVRHPRTAVGISADGSTLLLVAVDGRQPHSRGATLAELGELMKSLGAHGALNLDGGGSTALVLQDRATGVFTVANRPSERAAGLPETPLERPVVDVLGVRVREHRMGN